MKKLFLIGLCVIALASCSISKSASPSYNVGVEVQAYKAASLDVNEALLRYTYIPTSKSGKVLSEAQLVQNAIFEALKDNAYDTMVGVSYSVDVKWGLFGKKVTRVVISGYPAKYKDFREPTETDRKNGEAFGTGVKVVNKR